MIALRDLTQDLVDLLAPPRCPGCDGELVGIEEEFCGACGPLLDAAPRGVLPPARSASLYVYAGPLADAIRRVKYRRRTDLLGPLARLLVGAVPAYGGRVDAVVPVPLHRRRLAERGFNQAALLGRPLARALGVPLVTGRLVRVRPTPPQAELAAAERRDNVRGAFALRRPLPDRVLLVDDVRTTGATLAEAARTLADEGHDVFTLTLARAPRASDA